MPAGMIMKNDLTSQGCTICSSVFMLIRRFDLLRSFVVPTRHLNPDVRLERISSLKSTWRNEV